MARKKYNRRVKNKKRWYIPISVFILFFIMGSQLFTLYQKKTGYEEKEAQLRQEIKSEQQRSEDLEEYEQYTKTDEYVTNTAHTKLGLVKDNEIIFKEK